MDVPGAVTRDIEHLLGKEQAIGGDDQSIRTRRSQAFRVAGLQALRLEHGQATRQGQLLYRAAGGAHTASRGPVGLRED
jgi:hypothetical protein